MANSKISALTSATTPLAGTEVLPVVQSSTTKQVSVANLTAGRAVSMLSATAGNVQISGNTIVTTDTNGNLTINPNGSGYTIVVSSTNGTIAQWGDTTSRTFYVKSANVGGFDNDTLINESDSGVGQFQWKNSGATLWTMNATGNLVPATAAKGINFTANTPAAGMTSQLLNWYEEGSWTPTDASGAGLSLTITYAKYVRVGKSVTVNAFVTYPATASAAAATIGGLPFNVASNNYPPVTFANNSGTAISGFANAAAKTISIGTAANYSASVANSVLSGKVVLISLTYLVD